MDGGRERGTNLSMRVMTFGLIFFFIPRCCSSSSATRSREVARSNLVKS
jgi:hypothetical protein